jgi:hypothetical protein
MLNTTHAEHLLLGRILNLLSDVEVATVSTEQTASRLLDGDEYLYLGRLGDGVLQSPAQVMARVLLRRAVRAETWNAIVTLLPRAAA